MRTCWSCLCLFALFIGHTAWACAPLGGDGKLVLYSYPHQTLIEVTYRHSDQMDATGLAKIRHALRSPDGVEATIDLRLIALLDQIQDHFGADTVEIISGYRSPAYNGRLKTSGHAVARESQHLKGLAADIHFDEISEMALRDYARALGCGGVGFYPSLNFVHVDLGPMRSWEERAGARKLVGEGTIVYVTDRNTYRSGEPVPLGVAENAGWTGVMESELALEYYHRGIWRVVQRAPAHETITLRAPQFAYGKYRFHRTADPAMYSNEFYFKKQ
ncbi:MAG: YcbK family protein [Deltaproteobacteria bacterium]|nr:YcbK family protein [Deltaproteobacteria bacterium]